jgi:hypothetical protein
MGEARSFQVGEEGNFLKSIIIADTGRADLTRLVAIICKKTVLMGIIIIYNHDG